MTKITDARGLTDKQTNKQTDRQTNRPTNILAKTFVFASNKQTDRPTYLQKHLFSQVTRARLEQTNTCERKTKNGHGLTTYMNPLKIDMIFFHCGNLLCQMGD